MNKPSGWRKRQIQDKVPVNKWSIAYPDEDGGIIIETLTEDEIIEQYFPYWSGKMTETGHAHMISRELCIEDWCTVHWAEKVVD